MPSKRKNQARTLPSRQCKKARITTSLRRQKGTINYDESNFDPLDYIDESDVIEISSDDRSEVAIVNCVNPDRFTDTAKKDEDSLREVVNHLDKTIEQNTSRSDISAFVSNRSTISISESDTLSSIRSTRQRTKLLKQKESRQVIEEMFIVEKILAMREVDGVRQFYLQWEGFPESSNTWEPEENIDSKDIIMEYLAELDKKQSSEKSDKNLPSIIDEDDSKIVVIEDNEQCAINNEHQQSSSTKENTSVIEEKRSGRNVEQLILDDKDSKKRIMKKKSKRKSAKKIKLNSLIESEIDLTVDEETIPVKKPEDESKVIETLKLIETKNSSEIEKSTDTKKSSEKKKSIETRDSIKTRNSIETKDSIETKKLTETGDSSESKKSTKTSSETIESTIEVIENTKDVIESTKVAIENTKDEIQKTEVLDTKSSEVDLTLDDEDTKEDVKEVPANAGDGATKVVDTDTEKEISITDKTKNDSICSHSINQEINDTNDDGDDNEESSDEDDENSVHDQEDIHSQGSDDAFNAHSKNNSKTNINNLNTYFPENLPQDVQEIFQVEKILRMRYSHGKRFFYLKWEGFPISENSWEPEENLECPELIEDFLNEQKKLKVAKKPEMKLKLTNKGPPVLEILPGDVKIKEPAVKPRGFPKDREAELIIGSGLVGGELHFLIKWKNVDMANLVPARRANIECPQVVIKFYESNLTWQNLDGSITMEPKEKVNVPPPPPPSYPHPQSNIEDPQRIRSPIFDTKKPRIRKSSKTTVGLAAGCRQMPPKPPCKMSSILPSRQLPTTADRMLNIINSLQASKQTAKISTTTVSMLDASSITNTPHDGLESMAVPQVCQYESRELPQEPSPPPPSPQTSYQGPPPVPVAPRTAGSVASLQGNQQKAMATVHGLQGLANTHSAAPLQSHPNLPINRKMPIATATASRNLLLSGLLAKQQNAAIAGPRSYQQPQPHSHQHNQQPQSQSLANGLLIPDNSFQNLRQTLTSFSGGTQQRSSSSGSLQQQQQQSPQQHSQSFAISPQTFMQASSDQQSRYLLAGATALYQQPPQQQPFPHNGSLSLQQQQQHQYVQHPSNQNTGIIYQNSQYQPLQYQYVFNNGSSSSNNQSSINLNLNSNFQSVNGNTQNSFIMPHNNNNNNNQSQIYYSPPNGSLSNQINASSPRPILPRNADFGVPANQMPVMLDSQTPLQTQQNNQLLRNSYLNLGAFL